MIEEALLYTATASFFFKKVSLNCMLRCAVLEMLK